MIPETAEQRDQRENVAGVAAIRAGELLRDLRLEPDRQVASRRCRANHPLGCFLIELTIIRLPPHA